MTLAAGICLGGHSVSLRATEPTLGEGWSLIIQARAAEAADIFRPMAGVGGQRPADLGVVVALMGEARFSEKTLRDVRKKLADLIAVNSSDQTGIHARYLLGRIRQIYEDERGESAELVELARAHPAHYLAQLAMIKLLQHRLYAFDPSVAASVRLAAAETAGDSIFEPSLRRDYHLLMGDAYLYYGDQQAPALRHFCAAQQIGLPEGPIRATVLVQIGELGRLQHKPAVAVAAYRQFLAEFPRDVRTFEVGNRLAGLGETQ